NSYSQTVYKCPNEGPEGSLLYSDEPCQNDTGGLLNLDETSLTTTGGITFTERQKLREIERMKLKEKSNRTQKASRTIQRGSDAPQKGKDNACEQAHLNVREWQEHMRQPYRASMSQYLHDELHKRMKHRNDAC